MKPGVIVYENKTGKFRFHVSKQHLFPGCDFPDDYDQSEEYDREQYENEIAQEMDFPVAA